jgi:hypothetical protein
MADGLGGYILMYIYTMENMMQSAGSGGSYLQGLPNMIGIHHPLYFQPVLAGLTGIELVVPPSHRDLKKATRIKIERPRENKINQNRFITMAV